MPWLNNTVQVGGLIALVAALSACEPTPPQPKLGSAPVDSSPAVNAPAKTDAVQGLQADAATVAQSDGASPGAAPATASALNELKAYVGTYPSDQISFLEQGALADRLKPMLGAAYPVLLTNLRTASPLTEDQGRWFITGNRPHEGGSESAAVVVDAAQNAVRVWLQHDGQIQEFLDPPGVTVAWPQDVQIMLNNLTTKS